MHYVVNKYGKLFIDLSKNRVICIKYDLNKDYYLFNKEIKDKKLNQYIITSNIMISIINYFVLNYNAEIISIKFMDEDNDLDCEISSMLSLMGKNIAYWDEIKQKLLFLSENDCIEMKEVSLKISKDINTIFSIKSNGMIIAGEREFDMISNKVLDIIDRYLD